MGIFDRQMALVSGGTKLEISVATYPGGTEFARAKRTHSTARERVRWITPALAALYCSRRQYISISLYVSARMQRLGAKEGAVKERPVRCEEGRAGMAQHMTTRLTADCNCGIFAMCPLILAVAINEP